MTPEPQEQFITLQQAADELGVHYMTAYRWIRKGDLDAYKMGGRLRIAREELAQFARQRRVEVAVRAAPGAGRTEWPRHVDTLYRVLREGHADEVKALARKVILDGATAGEVYTHLLTPVLYRIGDDWAAGTITVSDEHRATAIVAAVIATLSDSFRRRSPSRGVAVTLTMAGDRHELASAMVADHARAAGYEVHHLGGDVPTGDLAEWLRRTPVTFVLVSVTTPPTSATAYSDIVQAAREAGVSRVLFGGQSADPDLIARAGGEHVTDVTALVRCLSENVTTTL